MQRQKLVKRLRSLRNLELFNIFFLPACLGFVLSNTGITHWQAYYVSMAGICVILAQGVFYWHLKLNAILKNESVLPAYSYPIFSLFKWANLFLLAVYPVLFLLGKLASRFDFNVTLWSSLLYVFGILEYVNYYHYQLSHDQLNDIRYLIRHNKFRRSPLWTDLQHHRDILALNNTLENQILTARRGNDAENHEKVVKKTNTLAALRFDQDDG